MTTLCEVFRVHRSSHKYWKNRPEKPDGRRAILRSQVLELHNISHGSAGARNIATMATLRFARELNLEPCTTAVSSPQSNGMEERLVKTMKEDYIAFMPKPDARTALRNLAAAFTHYNENHPHSALGYDSAGEYRRQRASLT